MTCPRSHGPGQREMETRLECMDLAVLMSTNIQMFYVQRLRPHLWLEVVTEVVTCPSPQVSGATGTLPLFALTQLVDLPLPWGASSKNILMALPAQAWKTTLFPSRPWTSVFSLKIYVFIRDGEVAEGVRMASRLPAELEPDLSTLRP